MYGQSYDLSKFDYKFLKILKDTSDDLLKRWLPKICNILLAVRNLHFNLSSRKYFLSMLICVWCQNRHIQASKKGNLPPVNNPQYNRFFNCLAYVMEDQLRDLCLRSMEDYINYLMDVGVSIYLTDFGIRLKICF